MDRIERVRAAAESVAEAADLFLEDVSLSKAGSRSVLRVTVDLPSGPGGVSSDALADFSRELSRVLDDVDVLPTAYTLEVSTPGATRPLTEPRHFSRAQGRLLAITDVEGHSYVGRLISVESDILHLVIDGDERDIRMGDVRKAVVELEMK